MLLVYDGDCGFCTRSARWIERRLPPSAHVESYQSIDIDALGLTLPDVTSAAWWFEKPGAEPLRGHAAIGASLAAAGGVWRPIGWLIAHPPVGWIARPIYAVVAGNRGRLPGATTACRVDPLDRDPD